MPLLTPTDERPPATVPWPVTRVLTRRSAILAVMGLFDRAKAAIDAAKDKVSDVTGIDTDKLLEAGKSVVDAGTSLEEAASALKDGKRE